MTRGQIIRTLLTLLTATLLFALSGHAQTNNAAGVSVDRRPLSTITCNPGNVQECIEDLDKRSIADAANDCPVNQCAVSDGLGGSTCSTCGAGGGGGITGITDQDGTPTADGPTVTIRGATGSGITTSVSGDIMEIDSSGGGGGAPTDAVYLVLSANGTLTDERILDVIANTPLVGTDNGAGNDFDLDFDIASLTADASPGAGDWLLIELSGGGFRKVDWSNLPSASEVNNLEMVATGIQADEIPMGAGVDTILYKPMPSSGTNGCSGAGEALQYNTSTDTWTCLTGLGAGGTVDSIVGDDNVNPTTAAALSVDGDGAGISTDSDGSATLTVSLVPASVPADSWTDAQVSDTLTASKIVGSGSTTDAVDLATAEVAGRLLGSKILTTDLDGTGLGTSGDELVVDLVDTPGGTTATTGSESGLEFSAGALSLLRGCGDGQLVKWTASTEDWSCAGDATSGGFAAGLDAQETPAGTRDILYDGTAKVWHEDADNDGNLEAGDKIVGGNGVIHVVDFDGGGVGGSDIVAAITAASAGDTIVLPNQSIAVTDGQVDLNKAGLTLTGLGESSELTGTGTADLVHVSASDVTVSNLLLTSTTSASGAEAIRCNTGGNTNLRIEGVKISMVDTTGGVDGISIVGCDHTSIRNVEVTADRGMHVTFDGGTFPHIWVSDSTFTGGDEGIDISGARTVSVRNSLFSGQDVDAIYNDHAATILVLESNRFFADAGADNVEVVEGCLTSIGNAYATATDALVVESTVNDITCITSANDVISGNVVNLATGLDLALLNATGGFGTTGSTGTVTNVPLNRLPVLDSNDDLPLPGDLTIGSSTLAWDAGNSELDLSTDLNVTGGVQANSIDIACDGVGGCFVALKDNSATPATPAANVVRLHTQGTGAGAIPDLVGYVDDGGNTWHLQELLHDRWAARSATFTVPVYTSPGMVGLWSGGAGNGNISSSNGIIANLGVRVPVPEGYTLIIRDFAVTVIDPQSADCEVAIRTTVTLGDPSPAEIADSVIQIGPNGDNCDAGTSCTDDGVGRTVGTYTGPDLFGDTAAESAIIETLSTSVVSGGTWFVQISQNTGGSTCNRLDGAFFNVGYDLVRDEN